MGREYTLTAYWYNAMGMNIKNQETYRLTKQFATLTGEGLTTAVTEAVRERVNRVRDERGADFAQRLLMGGTL
jgi:antitoxin VapB